MAGGQEFSIDPGSTVAELKERVVDAFGLHDGETETVLLDAGTGNVVCTDPTVRSAGLVDGQMLMLIKRQSYYVLNATCAACYVLDTEGTFNPASPAGIKHRLIALKRVDREEYPWTVNGFVVQTMGKFTVKPDAKVDAGDAPKGEFYIDLRQVRVAEATDLDEFAELCEHICIRNPLKS
eukprot:TRINITY_DN63752_c0_g1_i1.p1 TRINITY_DN63752_c0_g1~~TRINITY_DN63752_c0_g1_i1.p1  ORF type:complete len:204 (+),score=9.84 TRINITY_DN63752_c0_g1_i1:74-613(+)